MDYAQSLAPNLTNAGPRYEDEDAYYAEFGVVGGDMRRWLGVVTRALAGHIAYALNTGRRGVRLSGAVRKA